MLFKAIILLAVAAVYCNAQSTSGSCSASTVTGNLTDVAKKTFAHSTQSTVAACIAKCQSHPFCLTLGYNPNSDGTGGTCMLSYYSASCTGTAVANTDAAASTSTAPQALSCFSSSCSSATSATINTQIPSKPNFIILLVDDFGYGDLASFGNPVQEWGPVDDMALAGLRFKQWYAPDSLCSPSRVGLQTGRWPGKVGMYGGIARVFLQGSTTGIPHSEVTIAERLRSLGYTTGMSGKWHMGMNEKNRTDAKYSPLYQGYDYAVIWLPFSNDWNCDAYGLYMPQGPWFSRCFLYNMTTIIQQPVDFNNIAPKMFVAFTDFLNKYGSNPWYYYYAFPHIHAGLFRSKPFVNTSRRGMIGDNLNEMNYYAGQILDLIAQKGQTGNTMVVFTADHGPHVELCESGGVTGGLKGGKSVAWEGGMRVPGITYWPGVIRPGGISYAVISSMDIYPSFVKLAGGTMVTNLTFDGQENSQAMLGLDPDGAYKTKPLFYWCEDNLFAIRYKNLKFNYYLQPLATTAELSAMCPGGFPLSSWFKGNAQCNDPEVQKLDVPVVFDLLMDPFESFPINGSSFAVGSLYTQALAEVGPLKSAAEAQMKAQQNPRQLNFLLDTATPCCSGNLANCTCGWDSIPAHWNLTSMNIYMTDTGILQPMPPSS